MKIIAHKNNLYNTEKFMKEALASKELTGISIDITITKDNQIAVLSLVSENNVTLQNLQNSNLMQFHNEPFLTLEEMLYAFANSDKKIVVNFLPLVTEDLSDENIKDINNRYQEYIKIAVDILKRYAYADLYLCSINDKAIYFLKQYATFAKIGMVMMNGVLNYHDVDFFVFTTGFLDEKIFEEQLNRGKEIMIAIRTNNDLNQIWNIFSKKNQNPRLRRIFDSAYFLNDYPQLFYYLFASLED